jgi:hypothetical protein
VPSTKKDTLYSGCSLIKYNNLQIYRLFWYFLAKKQPTLEPFRTRQINTLPHQTVNFQLENYIDLFTLLFLEDNRMSFPFLGEFLIPVDTIYRVSRTNPICVSFKRWSSFSYEKEKKKEFLAKLRGEKRYYNC